MDYCATPSGANALRLHELERPTVDSHLPVPTAVVEAFQEQGGLDTQCELPQDGPE